MSPQAAIAAVAQPKAALRGPRAALAPITLSIDIGGSGIKAMLLDARGKPISTRERIATPAIPSPRAVMRVLDELRERLPGFDRVSVGFPGVVQRGVIYTAANLHPKWAGILGKSIQGANSRHGAIAASTLI